MLNFVKWVIENGRVLDLHYPDRQVIALLIHNDYADELTVTFAKYGVAPCENFDPCNEKTLRDLKYTNLTVDERQSKAIVHHHDRLTKALDFIQEPVKFSVVCYFAQQGWITVEELKTNYLKTP